MKTVILVLAEKQKELADLMECIQRLKDMSGPEQTAEIDVLFERVTHLKQQVDALKIVLPMFEEEIHSLQ